MRESDIQGLLHQLGQGGATVYGSENRDGNFIRGGVFPSGIAVSGWGICDFCEYGCVTATNFGMGYRCVFVSNGCVPWQ